MISLLKMIGGTWDQAKGYLRLDLDHLQSAINQRWAATFGDNNLLLPSTIPGNTTTPLYVANTGPGQTLQFDLVDLGSGVKGVLPFSHIVPASTASLLLGRGSAFAGGSYQEITVGTGLAMTGQTLSNTGVPGPSGPAGPPGSNGALVLLEQHSASTSATLDFTTGIVAAYDEYMIEFVNVIPATDAQPFLMRVSTNGGSTYDAGTNYYWNAWDFDESASATSGSQAATAFQLLSVATNQANYSLNGSIKLFNPAGPAYTTFEGMVQARASTADAHVVQWMTGGTYLNATAVNAVRFLFTTGSITSGTIRMYGISKVAATGGAVGPQGVPGLDGADGTDGLDGIPSPYAMLTDDNATNASMYPVWVSATPGNEQLKTSSTLLTFNPSTGVLLNIGAITAEKDAIGAGTGTNAIIAQNTTLSTAVSTSQNTPNIQLLGHMWNTTSAADNQFSWLISTEAGPGLVPVSTLRYISTINGVSTVPFTILSTGATTLSGTASSTLLLQMGQQKMFLGGGFFGMLAVGQFNFNENTATKGFGFDCNTDTVCRVRTRAQTGDASLSALNITTSGTLIDKSYNIAAPATLATVTMSANQQRQVINPAGTIAVLTVTLPPTPTDAQIAGISFTQIVSALTVNAPGGATVVQAPTSAAVDTNFRFIYQASSTSWFPAS